MSKIPILDSHLERSRNSYSFIRLLAAMAVIFSHATIIVGGPHALEPLYKLTGQTLGWHAVNVFFVLSGAMVTASLFRTENLWQFLWARILRIYPALLIVSLLVFLLAVFINPSQNWPFLEITEYFARHILLFAGGASLEGTFANNPMAEELNAPLWTLKYELIAYLSLATAFIFFKIMYKDKNWKTFLTGLTLLILSLTLILSFWNSPHFKEGYFEHFVRFGFAFYLGVFCFIFKKQIILRLSVLLALAAIYTIFLTFEIYYAPIQIIFMGYLALYLGHFHWEKFSTFFDRQDYSYGLYILAYPVQQLLVYNLGTHPAWVNFTLSLVITTILAFFMWNIIEKPSLRLKKHFKIMPNWCNYSFLKGNI